MAAKYAVLMGAFQLNPINKMTKFTLLLSREKKLVPDDLDRLANHFNISDEVYDKFLQWIMVKFGSPLSGEPALVRGLSEIYRCCQIDNLYNELLLIVDSDKSEVEQKFLRPLGGIISVARAPSLQVIEDEMRRRFSGDAMRAGLTLATRMRLVRHNELSSKAAQRTASVNRAIFIIESASTLHDSKADGKSPTGSATMKAWVAWKQMSPIWAGIIAAANYDLSGDALLEAVRAEGGVAKVIGMGKWFFRAATEQRSQHSAHAVLDPATTVRINVDVTEIEPPLPPLSPTEVRAMKAYRA